MEEMPKRDTSCLNFLFAKISMPKPCMSYWLTVPEFTSEVFKLYDSRKEIDDKAILPILEKLYTDLVLKRKNHENPEINYHLARSSINSIRKILSMEPLPPLPPKRTKKVKET